MSFSIQEVDEVVEKLFVKYDKDKNGYLDKGELSEFISATYKKMGRPNPSNA